MKFSFKNDYSEGCHPKILEALSQYNLDQQNGYGLDIYSENAANIIRENQNPQSLKFIW
jgi:threonine aldolase